MFLIMNLTVIAFASDSSEKEPKLLEKVRAGIVKLGTGPDAKIQVTLKDGTKLKGYVRDANHEQFVLVDSQGNVTPVKYPQVNHFSKKAVGWLIIAGLVITLVVIAASVKN